LIFCSRFSSQWKGFPIPFLLCAAGFLTILFVEEAAVAYQESLAKFALHKEVATPSPSRARFEKSHPARKRRVTRSLSLPCCVEPVQAFEMNKTLASGVLSSVAPRSSLLVFNALVRPQDTRVMFRDTTCRVHRGIHGCKMTHEGICGHMGAQRHT
jgi:hypothetical protein